MKHLSISVIIFLLFFGLASEYYAQVIKPEDLLTLELTFGSEIYGTKDEYLLVIPGNINVNEKGDIIFEDEFKIKVFDRNGKGNKLIGRKGQGPGEFSYFPTINISPKGFITAFESSSRRGSFYTIFDPDYKLIDKIRFIFSPMLEKFLAESGISPENFGNISNIVALDNTSIVYEMDFYKGDNQIKEAYSLLAYEDPSDFIPIFYGEKSSYFSDGNFSINSTVLGMLHWQLLPGSKIFYLETSEDKIINENTGEYTFHIVSIDKKVDKKYSNKFTPNSFSKEYIERHQSNEERQMFRKKKYYCSVKIVLVDHNYVFLFLNGRDKMGNIITHVFDIETERFVNEFSLPLSTNWPGAIYSGYLYMQTLDSEGFPIIYKYKIHPSVYGK